MFNTEHGTRGHGTRGQNKGSEQGVRTRGQEQGVRVVDIQTKEM